MAIPFVFSEDSGNTNIITLKGGMILIHVLVGEGASGKTTIVKQLEAFGLQPIISFTTRPKRENEVDGVDYHFITEEEFIQKLHANEFAEHNIFNDWYYGYSLQGIAFTEKDYVAIMTPSGLYKLNGLVGKGNVASYYIQVSERERLIRMAHRGDAIDEIFRRLQKDREDFHMFQQKATVVIENVNVGQAVCEVMKHIANYQMKEVT